MVLPVAAIRIEPNPTITIRTSDTGKTRKAASATEATPRIDAPVARRLGCGRPPKASWSAASTEPTPEAAIRKPKSRRVAPQLVRGEGRDQHIPVHAGGGDGADHHHGQQDDRRPANVREALCEVVDDRTGRGRAVDPGAQPELALIDEAKADDHGQEAQPVDEEGRCHAKHADGEPGGRGSHDTGAVEHGRVEGDGVADVLAPDKLDRERLANRHVDRIGGPEEKGQQHDHPDLDDVRDDERSQHEGKHHHHRLDGDEDAPLRQRVGSDPGEEPEHHDRQELRGCDDAQPDRVAGELQDEPGLGDLLHPGPDERYKLSGEEEPSVRCPKSPSAWDR